MFDRRQDLTHTVVSGLDLLIDFATLGEYGIEPQPAAGRCDDRPGGVTRSVRRSGWEAIPQARRGACRADLRRAPRAKRDLELWFRA
jgi:hypothetical protein